MKESSALSSTEYDKIEVRQPPSINIKRVLTRALRNWYILIITVLIGLATAYFINRYATPTYNVVSSIIVREGVENAGAEFLYKSNPLVNPYRNFYNELYIMRSYPLLQQVIEQLNFEVTWYREGNIKTVEVYDSFLPRVQILAIGKKSVEKELIFRGLTKDTYSLQQTSTDDISGTVLNNLNYGDTIKVNGNYMIFHKREDFRNEMLNKPYIIRFKNPYSLAQLYAEKLRTTWAEAGSSVVNLSIDGPIAEKEIDFINKFIERYQQYDVEKKNQVATKSIEFLDGQLSAIGDSLQYFDNQIEQFKKRHFTTDFEGEASAVLERIKEFDNQKKHLELYENYFNYLEEYLMKSALYDQIVPPSAVGITDVILNDLIKTLTEMQFGVRMLADRQANENPLVSEQKIKIEQVKRDIIEGIKAIKKTQEINRTFINNQIQQEEKVLSKFPEAERNYFDIKRSYIIRENLYLFLMQKRAEAGISRASTTSDIIVVNPPARKGGSISPRPIQNYLLGLMVGLIVPIMFFVLVEFFNDKILSKEDIEQNTDIPIIGIIGHSDLTEKDENLVVLKFPKSAVSEAFRALRSNLNYFTHGQDRKIILVTSSVSGEGKTFTTLNLATIMAFSGKRVIVIGADMRRPKLFNDFGLTNEKGLSSFLASLNTLPEVIQKTNIENLDLISGGPVPPNPSELLMLPKLQDLMNNLLEEYDYVLIDSPPLGLVSDAFSLIPLAHHTLFMVRQDYTLRNYLRDLDLIMYQRNISNVSILFNDLRKTGPGYGYGYGYGYAYGYNYGWKKKINTSYYEG